MLFTRHLAPLVAVVALAASACGSSGTKADTGAAVTKSEAPLANLLPQALRDRPKLEKATRGFRDSGKASFQNLKQLTQ